MTQKTLTVLVLCTGNSCRSIIGEALVNHLGAGRVRAFSAGSHPVGKVNENALATLARHGLPIEGYSSKSWDDLENENIDIVITVCDNAAGEVCPAYLGQVVRAHWGLPDPAHACGSPEIIAKAFEETYAAMEKRIQKFLALPLEALSRQELTEKLKQIGSDEE